VILFQDVTEGGDQALLFALEAALETFRFSLSAVESKPASWGRIKTSHFFPINRSKMFWQEADLRFFEQWR
jgi:hypothetical protein